MQNSTVQQREEGFFEEFWASIKPTAVTGSLVPIPGAESLRGKRVLISSCGSGLEPVRAAKAGAEVHTFDISPQAVTNAIALAEYNQVNIRAEVMSFENLKYENDFFDVIFGSFILHHVDCKAVSAEIFRCLKPGGIAYFLENSARNPIARWARRIVFGEPGKNQRQKFLFFRRHGTPDEYPLTDEEIDEFRRVFSGQVKLFFDEFIFFQLLHLFALPTAAMQKITASADNSVVKLVPSLMKYSYHQNVWMQKP